MNQPQTGAPRPAVSKWLLVVLIIVILAGGGFFAWFYLMGPGKKVATTTTPTTTATPSTTTTTPAKTNETADWKTYTDSELGFSIKYPNTWSVEKSTQDASVSMFSTADPIKGSYGTIPNILIGYINNPAKPDYSNADLYLKNIRKLSDDQIKTTTINGNSTYYHESPCSASDNCDFEGVINLLVQRDGGGFYEIRITLEKMVGYNDLSSEYKNILSTFQITK